MSNPGANHLRGISTATPTTKPTRWIVGVDTARVEKGDRKVVYVIDEREDQYLSLRLVNEPDTRAIADLLFAILPAVNKPDRIQFVGRSIVDAEFQLRLSTTGIPFECSEAPHHRLEKCLSEELLCREVFETSNQAALCLEDYRLRANAQSIQPLLSEKLSRGMVQPAFADPAPDILLLHLLNWYSDKRIETDVFAPIGSAHIASALRDEGYRVRLELYRHDGKEQSIPASVRTAPPPRIVGISATGHEIFELKKLSIGLKELLPEVPIVVGGYCTLDQNSLFEQSAIDVVVRSEGEDTIRELVPALLRGDRLGAVKGIDYREPGGTMVHTAERPSIDELDSLPLPAYTHIPDSGLVRVAAARGCPYTCTYCEIKDFYPSRNIRYHGADYIKTLIQQIDEQRQDKVDIVYFNDDEFLLYPRHLQNMAGVARDLSLKIGFETRTRDIISHREVIAENRDVLYQVHLGVESFSQSQLDRWKKRVTVAQNRQALEILSDLGVSYYPYMILSDADTAVEELDENISGMLAMPASVYPVRLRDGSLTQIISQPTRRAIRINRLQDFYGRTPRREETRYLDAVWFFVSATEKEVDSLKHLHTDFLVRNPGKSKDPDNLANSSLREEIGAMIDSRLLRLVDIAEEAKRKTTVDAVIEIAQHHAARYRAEAWRLMFRHLATPSAVKNMEICG